jgi:tryprostatin B 6-hydroxylase
MMNLRVTLAEIVMRYDLSFAPDHPNAREAFEEGMSDHFTLQPGPLYLRLNKRAV